MALRLSVLFLFAAVLCCSQASDITEGVGKTHDFVVYSAERLLRKKILDIGEESLGLWSKTLGNGFGPSVPVIIVDRTQQATWFEKEPIETRIYESETGGLKTQIDINDLSAMRGGGLEAEVFRALAIQAMYQKKPPKAGQTFSMPPGWFVEGFVELLFRKKSSAGLDIASLLSVGERAPDLNEFLRQNPARLSGRSLANYRAQAMALLQVFLKKPEASKRLADFMATPEFSEPKVEYLLAAFPEPGSDARLLSKLWTLEMATHAARQEFASFSIEETNTRLMAILNQKITGSGKDTAPLMEAAKGRGGAYLMRQCSTELIQLAFFAHPFFHPILNEYRDIVETLAKKPKARIEKRIVAVDKLRNDLLERSSKIADYLNWVEATQPEALESSILDSIPKVVIPRRTDAISLYLDGLEERGW
jgi:hypothetical protein